MVDGAELLGGAGAEDRARARLRGGQRDGGEEAAHEEQGAGDRLGDRTAQGVQGDHARGERVGDPPPAQQRPEAQAEAHQQDQPHGDAAAGEAGAEHEHQDHEDPQGAAGVLDPVAEVDGRGTRGLHHARAEVHAPRRLVADQVHQGRHQQVGGSERDHRGDDQGHQHVPREVGAHRQGAVEQPHGARPQQGTHHRAADRRGGGGRHPPPPGGEVPADRGHERAQQRHDPHHVQRHGDLEGDHPVQHQPHEQRAHEVEHRSQPQRHARGEGVEAHGQRHGVGGVVEAVDHREDEREEDPQQGQQLGHGLRTPPRGSGPPRRRPGRGPARRRRAAGRCPFGGWPDRP